MLKDENKEIEAAVNDLEKISQDTIDMLNYAREWRWKGQYEANMQESEDIGFAKGLAIGFEEGLAIGIEEVRAARIAEGRATGIAEERIKTAVACKKANVDIDIIVSCTGLSKEEVLAL